LAKRRSEFRGARSRLRGPHRRSLQCGNASIRFRPRPCQGTSNEKARQVLGRVPPAPLGGDGRSGDFYSQDHAEFRQKFWRLQCLRGPICWLE